MKEFFLSKMEVISETIITSYDIGNMEKFRIYKDFLTSFFELGFSLTVSSIESIKWNEEVPEIYLRKK